MKYSWIFLMFIYSFSVQAQIKGTDQGAIPENAKKETKVVGSTPSDLAKQNADKLKTSLKLNDTQHSALYKALLTYETDVLKVNQSKIETGQKFKKINVLNKTRQNAFKKIFSEKQYKQYLLSFP